MKPIKKAIFPVAGLGTRFLPVTKASPKEMLPVVDKPLIQYAVEEAIEAGIDEIIFITNGAKRAIEDHFDRNVELEELLRQNKKYKALSSIENILPSHVRTTYVRQSAPLGLGHAILCAKHLIQDEAFSVLLADDLMHHTTARCLKQLVDAYHHNNADGMIAIEKIDAQKTDQYGIVSLDKNNRIQNIVEKPSPKNAPSHLAVAGRDILPGAIFDALEKIEKGAGGEIQLTDAIAALLPNQKIMALEFQGSRYDCGSKLGYAQANFDYMLRDAEHGESFEAWVRKRMQ